MRKHINELLSLIKPINYTKEERNISDKERGFLRSCKRNLFPEKYFSVDHKDREKGKKFKQDWNGRRKTFLCIFYDINNNSLWWDNKSQNVSSACWGMIKSRKRKPKITFEGNKLWLTTYTYWWYVAQFSLHLPHSKGISNYNEFVQA